MRIFGWWLEWIFFQRYFFKPIFGLFDGFMGRLGMGPKAKDAYDDDFDGRYPWSIPRKPKSEDPLEHWEEMK